MVTVWYSHGGSMLLARHEYQAPGSLCPSPLQAPEQARVHMREEVHEGASGAALGVQHRHEVP